MKTCLLMILAVCCASAQPASQRIFYFPKPVRPTPYQPPMQPLVKLADLKTKHRGQAGWSELVIADNNTRAQVISAPRRNATCIRSK
jgi:hypothetical protein